MKMKIKIKRHDFFSKLYVGVQYTYIIGQGEFVKLFKLKKVILRKIPFYYLVRKLKTYRLTFR